MPLNLMILTSHFIIGPRDVGGGISYRYGGLYGSLVKTLLNRSSESKIFWYSQNDQCLRIISSNGVQRNNVSMLKACVNAISDTYKKGSYLAVILAYPYAIPKSIRLLEYISCLCLMKIFSLSRVRLIVDDFDPPVEAAYTFSEAKPSLLAVFYLRALDVLTLKFLSSIVITVNEFFKHYIARIYRIREERFLVVSNGSLLKFVPYVPTKPEGSLVVLYAGSAMKVKDVDKLVSLITRLRDKGLNIDLHIAGAKLMNLPDYVHVGSYDWPGFVKNVLSNSDVGVIPYPSSRFNFNHATPAKLFDYMAAGKPVISTNLEETGSIIRRFNCGLVAKDWNEFELHIQRLYNDRALAEKLGKNGRRAAEKYFNYETLAEELFEKIIMMFNVEH